MPQSVSKWNQQATKSQLNPKAEPFHMAANILPRAACPVGFEKVAKQRAVSSSGQEPGCGSVHRREGERGLTQEAGAYNLFPAVTPPFSPSARTAVPTTREQPLTFDPWSPERDGCGGVAEKDLKRSESKLCAASKDGESRVEHGGLEAKALEILAALGRVLDDGDSKRAERRDGAAGKERRKPVFRDGTYRSTSSDTPTMTVQDVAGRRRSDDSSDRGLGTGQQRRCPRHEGENVCLYCKDCWLLICRLCALEQHAECQGIRPLNKACREIRWQLLKLQTCVGSHMKAMQGMVLSLKPRMEELAQGHLRSAERSLALLDVVKHLLETLRQYDSGVDLLQQFSRRLDWLTKKVLGTTQSQLLSGNVDYPPYLYTCQETKTVLDLDTSKKNEENSGMRTNSLPAVVTNTDIPDEKVWPLSEWGAWADSLLPLQTANEVGDLFEEVQDYLENVRNGKKSSTSTLYEDMMAPHNVNPVGPMDLLDEMLQHISPQKRDFTYQPSPDSCRMRLDLRIPATIPEDEGKPFVTDMHVTETGWLVYLDAVNNALKCVHPRHPSTTVVSHPLKESFSVCSAGWDTVMVSSAHNKLSLFKLLRLELKLVLTLSTDHQYRGLARVSDSLVAAACPETRTIDLLDLKGRMKCSIRPLDFARGPELIGVTARGELLVVHQPATPPTTLVCCDLRGRVLWEHEMSTEARLVCCSKVVGAADGSVYYTLQGGAIYRFHPDTGELTTVLSTRQGIKYPSSLALDHNNRLVVTRNELLPVEQNTADPNPILLKTTEISFYIQEA